MSQIYLSLCQVSDAANPALPQLYEMLTQEKRAKADRFVAPKARRLFLVAHVLLQQALCRAGVERPHQFADGRYGKPYLPDHPHIQFNLSHTDGLVAVAIARDHEIGVDVEKRVVSRDIDQLSARVFTDAERAEVASSADPAGHFTQLWTAKEAVMKATGYGFHLPSQQIAFTRKASALSSLPAEHGPIAAWWVHTERLDAHWLALAAHHHFKRIDRVFLNCATELLE